MQVAGLDCSWEVFDDLVEALDPETVLMCLTLPECKESLYLKVFQLETEQCVAWLAGWLQSDLLRGTVLREALKACPYLCSVELS